MKRRLRWFAGLFYCLAAWCVPAFADVVFSQRTDTFQGVYLSQNGYEGLPSYFAYDQFRLPVATQLTSIDWQGITFGSEPAQSFVVSLYAVAGDAPGVSVYTASGAVQDERVGGSAEAAYFQDDYSMAIDFRALADTAYWVSIYAVGNGSHGWGVLLSDTGSHLGGEFVGDGDQRQFLPVGENLAIALEGAAGSVPAGETPEPQGLVLMGTGMVAVGLMLRRGRAGFVRAR